MLVLHIEGIRADRSGYDSDFDVRNAGADQSFLGAWRVPPNCLVMAGVAFTSRSGCCRMVRFAVTGMST